MLPTEATRYLLWFGAKSIAHRKGEGEAPTDDEFDRMVEAREATLPLAHVVMRIKPESYAYTPGKPFCE